MAKDPDIRAIFSPNPFSVIQFPVLTTNRLLLRQLVAADSQILFRLRSDEGVNQYLDRAPAQSEKDAAEFITAINKKIARQELLYWAILCKGEWAGTICLFNLDRDSSRAEIGYELLPAFQGKGIMQEALAAVIAFAREQLQLKTIDACTHPENVASIKLLLQFHFMLSGTNAQNKKILLFRCTL